MNSIDVARRFLCRGFLVGSGVALASLAVGAAGAAAQSPWWVISSSMRPTALARGGSGLLAVTVENAGNATAEGSTTPIVVKDVLPAGLKVVAIEAVTGSGELPQPADMTCSISPLECSFSGSLLPFEAMVVNIRVTVESSAESGEENTVEVSGGGSVGVKSVSRPIQVGEESGFGVSESGLFAEEEGGSADTQAGSHPFQLTNVINLNQTAAGEPVALPKDIHFLLPAGLIGDPAVIPECTDKQFSTHPLSPPAHQDQANECPQDTVIGAASITFKEKHSTSEVFQTTSPLFNMVPNKGEPARFAFYADVQSVFLDTSVRTGSDYGVTVSSNNTAQIGALLTSRITVWGVPGDSRHDDERGWECLNPEAGTSCGNENELAPPPFLSLPTSCTGSLQAKTEADSWLEPQRVVVSELTEPMTGLDGCDRLPFSPSISVAPDTTQGSSPTGLTVGVHVAQSAVLNPDGLAESALKDVEVTLPEGVSVDPSGANGLEACSVEQVGFTGVDATGTNLFTDGLPTPFCPNASKIGTVRIKLPILPNALEGAVYLAAQDENPFGSLVATYLVAEDPVSGVLIKLAGEVRLSETGQLVAVFDNSPQGPLEDAELHFFGGERAPLGTPARCGTYTTNAVFTPWSGDAPVNGSSSFQVTSGPDGSPCPGQSLPFKPSATAGSKNIQAGEFTPFTFTMSRADGEQTLQSGEVKLPEGLSGVLSGVELCAEPRANEGLCGPNSLIGETTVSVGVGSQPFTVKGGRVYLTGPYNGTGSCTPGEAGCAPFGLSIVNPAKAGPYDLADTKNNHPPCDCVLVRAKIEINPLTSALTISSDPPGSTDAIPTIIEGIPLEIQHVNVTTTRSNFQFNPTNCSKTQIVGVLRSAEGGVATIAVPFQVTNCASLKFEPRFSVSTSGKTSRADGASLTAKLSYPSGSLGKDANIAKVKVDLPKQLPSRLTTLQKACIDATFEANPADCPADSRVGHAKAIAPILPVPLEGPAYFVSHGGAKFPELIVVLQGYGVTIDVHGETFISKAGITSSTFATVPDQPVSSFELTLPEGPYSALAANGNLCQSKLAMPTAFTAQNGAEIHESTKIAVSGCAKRKVTKKHKKKRAKKSGRDKHVKR